MSVAHFPQITTDRLILEPFSQSHSGGVYLLWSNADVCRYSGDAQDWEGQRIELPARSPLDSDKILDFFIRRATEGTGVRWAMILKESGECIGALGLNALNPIPELAFHLHPDAWGVGYAGEACRAVMAWSENRLPARTMEAYIEEGNTNSRRLAKSLGFQATESSRDGATRFERISERPIRNA